MDFAPSPRATEMLERLQAFMDEQVFPAEPVYAEQRRAATAAGRPHDLPPVVEELKAEARERGLWNLFLPGASCRPLASSSTRRSPSCPGWSPAPRARGDELRRAGHRQHGGAAPVRHRRAEGAVAASRCSTGEIRSGFAMTEPDVASSDATQHRDADRARRRRVRHQRPQVVDHRRGRPALRGLHRDGQDRPRRRRAPRSSRWCWCRMDTPGVTIVRAAAGLRLPTTSTATARSCFDDVRVPVAQPARRGGRRLRDRPGPPRPRPDPPLHARDRDGRAGAGADGASARGRATAFGRPLADAGRRAASGSPSRGSRSSRPGCWCSRPPG